MENIERLIIDVKEHLERQLEKLERGVRVGFAEMQTRFDNQGARLERQGALLQLGNRWTARTNDWAEKIDAALDTKDREIAELRDRLDRIEKKNGHH